ncbi:MAG: hypothetical protein GC149_10685 [Gammaproteobacteria bacterium]|nr:hypothetical protein [Gammaproteobacteria bacterium]
MSALKHLLIFSALVTLAACGGSGGGSALTVNCGTASTSNITVTGTVQFERVPHSTIGFGLDYAATYASPARGVTVQAINTGSNTIVATTQTDASGGYSVAVPNNTQIKIRVLAEMVKTGALPTWNFSVRDNTSGNAQYALDGSSTCTGTTNETRNLTASSGWGGTSYTSTRAAAPFAILDTVYDGIQFILGVSANTNFPALNLYWSPNNTSSTIGTSYFNGSDSIYILGDQNVDTDEYDPSVIAHEWGHYIEANFSRSDSIGGYHSTGDRLDMRVAFGEGYGNAFSSMVRNDPQYADSSGAQQASGFGFNVETETVTNKGWYSESSVEKILYDLYDSNNSPADSDPDHLTLGFQPLWNVLINEEKSGPVFTSIYKFIAALKTHYAGDATTLSNIDTLINAQSIHVNDVYGTGEMNNTSSSAVLPIYSVIDISTPANVCVTKAFARGYGSYDYNVLGMNHYLRFTPATSGTYQFTISETDASNAGNPLAIFTNGGIQNYHNVSGTNTDEIFTETLTGGQEYMFEVYDYNMVNTPATSPSETCYDVSVVKQ